MKHCCSNCKDRKVGCHDNCEKFKAFRMENEEIKRREKEYMNPEIVRSESYLKWREIERKNKMSRLRRKD